MKSIEKIIHQKRTQVAVLEEDKKQKGLEKMELIAKQNALYEKRDVLRCNIACLQKQLDVYRNYGYLKKIPYYFFILLASLLMILTPLFSVSISVIGGSSLFSIVASLLYGFHKQLEIGKNVPNLVKSITSQSQTLHQTEVLIRRLNEEELELSLNLQDLRAQIEVLRSIICDLEQERNKNYNLYENHLQSCNVLTKKI